MGQPAIGACRTGRSTGGRSELGGACRFAPVVSQRVRARWSGSWSYVVRRVLWYACRGGRTFTAAASKWPTICNVTNGTAVGRRLLRWPLRAQLLCMSLAKNAVMMAPRAWRRSALSEDFEPFRGVWQLTSGKLALQGHVRTLLSSLPEFHHQSSVSVALRGETGCASCSRVSGCGRAP